MRLFIGTTNVTNSAILLQQGFWELGHDADVGLLGENCFYDTSNNRLVNIKNFYDTAKCFAPDNGAIKVLPIDSFWSFAKQYDLFVFISSHSLLPFLGDLKYLTILQKPVVCLQLGSDSRHEMTGLPFWEAYGHEFPVMAFPRQTIARGSGVLPRWLGSPYVHNLNNKLYHTRMVERFATTICTHPSIWNLGVRPHMCVQLPMDAGLCKFKVPGRLVPHVIHAPSKQAFKRTDIIITTLHELAEEGVRFTFQLVENKKNEEVLQLLTQCDVLIDQIACGALGRLALEGFCSGCAVVSGNSSAVPWPPERPALSVTPHNFKNRLRELLTNRELRLQLAVAGYEYMAKGWHSPVGAAQAVLDALARERVGDWDYLPTVFGELAVTQNDEPVPQFLQKLTLEVMMAHGIHPETDISRLVNEGYLPASASRETFPHWNLAAYQKIGPWNWCSKRLPTPAFEKAYLD